MPLVQVKAIEGVFSEEQKREIIERLTETLVSIEGERLRKYTSVFIEEVKGGNWGIGGKVLTAEDVKGLAAARA